MKKLIKELKIPLLVLSFGSLMITSCSKDQIDNLFGKKDTTTVKDTTTHHSDSTWYKTDSTKHDCNCVTHDSTYNPIHKDTVEVHHDTVINPIHKDTLVVHQDSIIIHKDPVIVKDSLK